jgi:hypothetical protein
MDLLWLFYSYRLNTMVVVEVEVDSCCLHTASRVDMDKALFD